MLSNTINGVDAYHIALISMLADNLGPLMSDLEDRLLIIPLDNYRVLKTALGGRSVKLTIDEENECLYLSFDYRPVDPDHETARN